MVKYCHQLQHFHQDKWPTGKIVAIERQNKLQEAVPIFVVDDSGTENEKFSIRENGVTFNITDVV